MPLRFWRIGLRRIDSGAMLSLWLHVGLVNSCGYSFI